MQRWVLLKIHVLIGKAIKVRVRDAEVVKVLRIWMKCRSEEASLQ